MQLLYPYRYSGEIAKEKSNCNKFLAWGFEGVRPGEGSMLKYLFPLRQGGSNSATGAAARDMGSGAHPILGWRYTRIFLWGGGNRKKALLSWNRNIYDSIVRYFIPFCCEQSCKPFYTTHIGKPLTEWIARRRKSGGRIGPAPFPVSRFSPPLPSTASPQRPVTVIDVFPACWTSVHRSFRSPSRRSVS